MTTAFSGRTRESSHTTRIGFTGSASTIACASVISHERRTCSVIDSRHARSVLRSTSGSSSRSVAFASPTRSTSVGYRMPIRVASRSIWTARAWSNSGRNCEYGKLEPTITRVSQSCINSQLALVPSRPIDPVT
ncbi:Uncharacterised protein [Mycobacteroides abscessus subsp. abscessus]|nr:Uncharacterised protein [Mycobacteroides abscessus subsp. abscessus]